MEYYIAAFAYPINGDVCAWARNNPICFYSIICVAHDPWLQITWRLQTMVEFAFEFREVQQFFHFRKAPILHQRKANAKFVLFRSRLEGI